MNSASPDCVQAGNRYRAYAPVPALLVIAVGLLVRFLYLDADPPLFFTGTTQALLTDPYNVIHFARNKALYDQWDIFDYHRWDVFKYSLSSGFSYLFFAFGGVSRVTANLSAMVLNLGGLLFFVFGMARQSRRAALISAVILFSNMTLIVYGRYPFLENGLIFISGLSFYVFTRWYPNRIVIVATGVLIALAVLSGKAFGIVVLLPPLVVIWNARHVRYKSEMLLLGSVTVLSGILLTLLFYGTNIMIVYRYVTEQSTGMYGIPESLLSPLTFFEHLVTLGGSSRVFSYAPFLLGLVLFAAVYLLLTGREIKDHQHRDNRTLFNVVWLMAGFLLLMLFNYRPLRYQLFLLLPLSGIVATAITDSGSGKRRIMPGGWRLVAVILLCWYVATQVFFVAGHGGITPDDQPGIVLYALGIALPAGFFFYRYRQYVIRILAACRAMAFIVLLVGMVMVQGVWIYTWLHRPAYMMRDAGEDMHQILGPNAVVAGPFSSALTIDNDIRSFIYMFGLTQKEPDLFDRFPITHLAVDLSNFGPAQRDYPFLSETRMVGRYWFRDVTVRILQRPDPVWGYDGKPYLPSEYELARSHFLGPTHDSTLLYIKRFMGKYPGNLSAMTLLSEYYLSMTAVDSALRVYDLMRSDHPNDYSLYFDQAFTLYKLGYYLQRPEYRTDADRLFERAVELNPHLANDIIRAKHEADSVVNRIP
ncbi:MAG: phospholipid carrier-dependent glycosyltransferase [candidate division Zixibacteria bacterium]|nr:phospholipid carrier-dependent glycosyltransferase [candidate division Zixibacteria bacterium]